MSTMTETLPDLSQDQLAALHDRMKAARQARSDREHRERGKAHELRRVRSKLTKVEAEINQIRSDQDVKLQAVAKLRDRLQKVEDMNPHVPGVGEEGMALVEALELATEKGGPVVSGITCTSNARSYRLLFDVAEHGTNWHTPLSVLELMVEELVQEQDRLQEKLEALEG